MAELHVLRWEKPPPAKRSGRKTGSQSSVLAQIAAELRDNAGTWAVIAESGKDDRGSAAWPTMIRTGYVLAFAPAGSFEATSRQRDGVRTIYARYVGEGGEHA